MAATACFKTAFCESGQSIHLSVTVAPSTKHTHLKDAVYMFGIEHSYFKTFNPQITLELPVQ